MNETNKNDDPRSNDRVKELDDGNEAPTLAPHHSQADSTISKPSRVVSESVVHRRFGDYEILEEIARGGMGVVYKARQLKLNRIVAIKMILAGQLASQEDVRRFYTEAEAAANLQHPNIVAIHEVGEHDGQHFFSMEYIEGCSLDELVRQKPLSARQAAEYVRAIARAIHYAHERQTLHRDLKPSNVLIDAFGQPHITDFGLAKKIEGGAELTGTGQTLGTPSYMPPEQAGGKRDTVGPASDVYSIGAMLYELLTGRPPFRAETPLDTILQVLDSKPLPPRMLNGRVSHDLEAICLKCLQKAPHDRYATANELVADLERYLAGEPVQADPGSASQIMRAILRESRHTEVLAIHGRVWVWQSGVVFLLFLVTNILIWCGRRDPFPYVLAWIPGVIALFVPAWFYLIRGGRAFRPVERQFSQVMWMFFATCFVAGVINRLMGMEILELLPSILLMLALALGCTAAILRGTFYLLAALCALSAVVVAVAPIIGPVFFGTAFALGLFIPGWKHSRYQADSK